MADQEGNPFAQCFPLDQIHRDPPPARREPLQLAFGDGGYQLVSGHHVLRAARIAHEARVPAVLVDGDRRAPFWVVLEPHGYRVEPRDETDDGKGGDA